MRAAAAIKARPLPWVVARVLALKAEYPGSPLVHTHAAELHLWHGDYGACEAECRAALALSETHSRWAWVGLGAARMFQGHVQQALDVFAQSDRRMLPGGPLHAYRADQHPIVASQMQ